MPQRTSILTDIVAARLEAVEARKRGVPLTELRARVENMPAPRNFAGALRTRAGRREPAVIAEFKRASPSAGTIRADADPAVIARACQDAGAACLSVLTEPAFFGGSDRDLELARAACGLPVIRKDFIIDPWQVWETRAMGADALLLIVAALDDQRLAELAGLGRELGLAVLVEIHDAGELERALRVPGDMIGINNRDLHRFETRLRTTTELAPRVPADRLVVAESGIRTRADIEVLMGAQVYAYLVGESLMRAADPGTALRALIGPDSGESDRR